MVTLTGQSSSADESVTVASNGFNKPFNSGISYHITSQFGTRSDPFTHKNKFHGGIDLATSCGTDILASADGIVYETGFDGDGLGNYVYIKHNTEQGVLYTAYGHMLDNSIVVTKGNNVTAGTKIGQVGNTGASTGCHLHFMIMKNKISFKEVDLINPSFVVSGLK